MPTYRDHLDQYAMLNTAGNLRQLHTLAKLKREIQKKESRALEKSKLAVLRVNTAQQEYLDSEVVSVFTRQALRLVTTGGLLFFATEVPALLSMGGAIAAVSIFGAALALAGAISLTVYAAVVLCIGNEEATGKDIEALSFVSDITGGPISFATVSVGSTMQRGVAKDVLLTVGEVTDITISLGDLLSGFTKSEKVHKQVLQSFDYLFSNYDLLSKDRTGKSLLSSGRDLSVAQVQKNLTSKPPVADVISPPSPIPPSPPSPPLPTNPPSPPPLPPLDPLPTDPPSAPPRNDVQRMHESDLSLYYEERNQQEREEGLRWVSDSLNSSSQSLSFGYSSFDGNSDLVEVEVSDADNDEALSAEKIETENDNINNSQVEGGTPNLNILP